MPSTKKPRYFVWLQNNPRAGASILAVVFLASAIFMDQAIIRQAQAHVKSISIGSELYFILWVGASACLASVAFGPKLEAFAKDFKTRKLSAKDVIIMGALLSPGALAYFYLNYRLRELGYDVGL